MKAHKFDPVSFIAGLVIALIGLAFLVPATPVDVIGLITDLGGWFWPAVLVAVGIGVLMPALISRDQEESTETTESPETPDTGS